MGAIGPDGNGLIQQLTGGSFVGLDDLVGAKNNAGTFNLQPLFVHKESRIAGAAAPTSLASTPISMWQYEGCPVCHGGIPGTTWANPTNGTTGSLGQASPGGGRTQRIIDGVYASYGQAGLILVYDRLGHNGGLDGTAITAQNVNGGSAGTLTRYGSAVNNFLAYEVYTGVGATATTITASYTNQNGTAGQTTPAVVFGGAVMQQAATFGFMSLAADDTGVQAVTGATLAATTGTVGSWGLVIGQPLLMVAVGASNQMVAKSFLNGPMPTVLSGACLSFVFIPTVSALQAQIDLMIEIAEK